MIWILLILAVVLLLFWPKIKTMFGGSSANTVQIASPAPAQIAPGFATSTQTSVGSFSGGIGTGVGNIVTGALTLPRTILGTVFPRFR